MIKKYFKQNYNKNGGQCTCYRAILPTNPTMVLKTTS